MSVANVIAYGPPYVACKDCGKLGGHGARWSMCSGHLRMVVPTAPAKHPARVKS